MPFDPRQARHDCPATTRVAYLNAGTFGPLPRVAAEAMRAQAEDALEAGRIHRASMQRWLAAMGEAREAFARILDADPDELALTHCTSDGCNTVVFGLDLREGDEVVTTDAEHPGLSAPLEELARTRGVVVHAAPPELDALLAKVGPRTRLLALSHVLFTSGATLPVARLAEAVKERTSGRAFVLVDGAQSVGAIDVSPRALGVDAYTVSGQKWLSGPSGTGALWVRPSALPQLGTPWPTYTSKNRFVSPTEPWTTARRLDASTITTGALEGLIASLRWHEAQRRGGAYAHAHALVTELRGALRARAGVRLVEVEEPSNLVSFTVEGKDARALVATLEEQGVVVRSIPGLGYVRASVGFWNDARDLERLLDAIG